MLFAYGSGLIMRSKSLAASPAKRAAPADDDAFDDEDDDDGVLAIGAIVHWWLSLKSLLRRSIAHYRESRPAHFDDDDGFAPEVHGDERIVRPAAKRPLGNAAARREPEFAAAMEPAFDEEAYDLDISSEMLGEEPAQPAQVQNFRSPAGARVAAPAPRPVPGARVQREAQTSLIGSGRFEMPSLHFLSEPKNVVRDSSLSKDALEQNARLLEGVLEDFGVKGEIIHVRPGPVVTLYELEPAPGIKSSRVIGLADDIARSMSAIAARVAVVPGRNAIGIELPNAKRETVYLREILASRDFETTKAQARAGARQDHRRRARHRRPRQDAASAGRRHHRLGQVGGDQHHDPVAALPHDAASSAG